jgi:peptidoglycan/LPS O-acetylase OafA/YrhL
MKFRYDINALRAIAVIGVILFHFKIPYFNGGFAGVDVFFVISGYLITRIIINSLEKQNFSFLEFYVKRIKRIVPALLVLITVITLVGFFFYFPMDYMTNERSAASSLLFVSNFLYWRTSNYFAQNTDNILIHTWSLSVEWQFYLVYPFFLYFLRNFLKNKKRFFLSFCLVTAIIFLGSDVYCIYHYNPAFYLLPSRSWEMMVGGVAFLSEGFINNLKYKKAIAYLGYSLILLSFLFINSDMLWPGVYTLLPVLATFCVIVANFNNFKLLNYKAIQFTGVISYSLYLWHWPLYVFAIYIGIQMNAINIIFIILLAFLLASVSYQYIESIKFDNKRMKLLGVLMALFVAGTITMSFIDINHIMFKPKALKIANYEADHISEEYKQFRMDVCFIPVETKFKVFDKSECLTIQLKKKNILLLGDSHAADLYESLQNFLEKKNINLIQATVPGCYPISTPEGSAACQDVMNYMYNDYLKQNSNKLDGVIISCNWIDHITGNNDKDWVLLKRTINYFTQRKIKIIIIGQNETYDISYPVIEAKEIQYNINIRQQYISAHTYKINVFLKKNLNQYIDIYNSTSIPPLSPGGAPYLLDGDHFTTYGADITVQKIFSDPLGARFINSITNTNQG